MTELLTSAELSEMMQRLETALLKISTLPVQASCVSPCTSHSKLESIVGELKTDVERLYNLFKGLDDLLKSYDQGKPGILSRIQDIERTLKSIEDSLKYLEADSTKAGDNVTKLRNMEHDCNMCRTEVTEKLDALTSYMKKIDALQEKFEQDRITRDMIEKRRSEEEQERKEEKKNLKQIAVGQALVIVLALLGFAWSMVKESYDATQQNKIIQQYLQTHPTTTRGTP